MRAEATLPLSNPGGVDCGPTLGTGRVFWLPADVECAVEIVLALGSLLCHQVAV